MKINVFVWVVSVILAGCGWDPWSHMEGHHHAGSSGKPEGPIQQHAEILRAFEGAIDHSPLPTVSLVSLARGGRQERGVETTLAKGHAVTLAATDPAQLDHDLQDGALSLVDVLLTARAIKKASYRLEGAGAEGTPSGAADEQIAREIHDLLLRTLHTHTSDCHALCAGDAAACGSRRSFGNGAPCEIAGKTHDMLGAHFGAGWCAEDFCPAMSEAKE